jgi:uncharacterized membrane-anchored protein YjiN (DUF445 family)
MTRKCRKDAVRNATTLYWASAYSRQLSRLKKTSSKTGTVQMRSPSKMSKMFQTPRMAQTAAMLVVSATNELVTLARDRRMKQTAIKRHVCEASEKRTARSWFRPLMKSSIQIRGINLIWYD